jgi:2-octaprenyl-6-methoxyphenol hydroxylase
MSELPEHVDIAIVGGGPVGAALALALRDGGLAVALLEARTGFASRDPRAIALSHGSRLILERLEVWPALAQRVTPIEAIHVSQQGGFGRAWLSAREAGVPALGYTVAYGDLYDAIAQGLPDSGASLISGARVTAVRPAAGCGLVEYESAGQLRGLTARLIVQADGGRSLPGAHTVKDYGASAVVCTVRTSRPHANLAYERFTPEGPIALLPLNDDYALVWTTPAERVEERLGLDERAFLTRLQAAFGERQGRFLAAGARAAFPLRLLTAAPDDRPGLVRIGNAAQTLHPVAGQGFNLGLRDAWKLAGCVLDSPRAALGGSAFLARYRAQRRGDVTGGIAMTDLLVEVFANDLPLLAQARGLALSLMDGVPALKRLFARKMMFGAQAW